MQVSASAASSLRALGLAWTLGLTCLGNAYADEGDEYADLSAKALENKVQGGVLAQIIGNLNGLPHEMKYIDEPGRVENYVPSMPAGARTDDDTDLEWLYVTEIARTGETVLPYPRIVELWCSHVNDGIWCANRYTRDLMKLGLEPPLTGRIAVNPWAEFNLSGQFLCESFGLMAPGMPQTASRLGLHYTQVSIDGEPAQATQLFATMIATAFFEEDLEKILDAGERAVDPRSKIAGIVREAREICRRHPEDWRAARRDIKDRWQVHNGDVRDWNGYELNTACTVAALIYGRGDLVRTLQTAFNLGWDCDNNAATAATIVGVMRGREWIDGQGWQIADFYRNTSRPGMPTDETISSFGNRVLECARLVIDEHGGKQETTDGGIVYRIHREQPANVSGLPQPLDRLPQLRAELLPNIESDLAGESRAQAAYLAICLGEAERIALEKPEQWALALQQLRQHDGLLRDVAGAPQSDGERLQHQFRRWNLTPPVPKVPQIDEQGWRQIAGNPDLGELTSEKQEPVDFAIWQAADGTWQLWSCIRNTKEAGVTRLLHRWEGQKLSDENWKTMGIAMRGDTNYGERPGGLQAPYVVRLDDEFLMFYGDWVNICLATSQDGKQFERASISGNGPQLFNEGEGNNARDAMLIDVDGLWHCYYSAMPDDRGAMFVRRSTNLRDWSKSEPVKVVAGGSPGRL